MSLRAAALALSRRSNLRIIEGIASGRENMRSKSALATTLFRVIETVHFSPTLKPVQLAELPYLVSVWFVGRSLPGPGQKVPKYQEISSPEKASNMPGNECQRY